jgi:hypothetical protein
MRAGASTAVAQVLVMAGSSLLGLLVARRLGSSGATDGFFAANAVYGIALFTAQSLRTTAPATLLDGRPDSLRRHVRAVGAIAIAILAVFGVLAAAADVIASQDAVSSLRTALLILAPAAVAQLLAGLLAARCAVLGEFARPAAAYAAGTLTMAVAFVALVGELGVDAIATAVAVGAFVSTIVMATVWRGAERQGRDPETAASDAADLATTVPGLIAQLLRGAIPVLASQVVITASILAAARVAPGDGTLYSYGTLAVAVFVAIVASPVSIVLAPEIARTWDRRSATLLPATATSYRLGTLLLPTLAIPVLLLGPAAADWVLTALSATDIETAFTVAAILLPTVLTTLLAMVPLVGSVAAGLLGRVAAGSSVVAVLHVPLAFAVATADSVALLAVEGVVAAVALSAVPVAVALRGVRWELTATVASVTMRQALPGAGVAIAVWALLGASAELGPNLVAVGAGLAVHLVVALTFGRDDLGRVLGYSTAS